MVFAHISEREERRLAPNYHKRSTAVLCRAKSLVSQYEIEEAEADLVEVMDDAQLKLGEEENITMALKKKLDEVLEAKTEKKIIMADFKEVVR